MDQTLTLKSAGSQPRTVSCSGLCVLCVVSGQNRLSAIQLPKPLSCLQEDFEFDGQARFQDPRSTSESTTPMEGENMGGWWPEHSTPDTGVRPAGQRPPACTWPSAHPVGRSLFSPQTWFWPLVGFGWLPSHPPVLNGTTWAHTLVVITTSHTHSLVSISTSGLIFWTCMLVELLFVWVRADFLSDGVNVGDRS